MEYPLFTDWRAHTVDQLGEIINPHVDHQIPIADKTNFPEIRMILASSLWRQTDLDGLNIRCRQRKTGTDFYWRECDSRLIQSCKKQSTAKRVVAPEDCHCCSGIFPTTSPYAITLPSLMPGNVIVNLRKRLHRCSLCVTPYWKLFLTRTPIVLG